MSEEPSRRTEVELQKLDKLLEHRTRLGICVLLARFDVVHFTRLRGLLKETDGNLGANLRKLEEKGYLSVKKEFVDRKPVSWYSLTSRGERRLKRHLQALQSVIQGVENLAEERSEKQ